MKIRRFYFNKEAAWNRNIRREDKDGPWCRYEDVEPLLNRTQKIEDYIESRLDELQERFRKSHADIDKVYYSIAIRELRHIKKELE